MFFRRYNSQIINLRQSNFAVELTGPNSIVAKESILNTPFGKVTVDQKEFSELNGLEYLMLQLNFEIEKRFIPIPIKGINDLDYGRLYKNRYTSLEATFVLGRRNDDDDTSIVDPEFGQPYYSYYYGDNFEIYYLPIAKIEKSYNKDGYINILYYRMNSINIPFFTNYYGIGSED